MIDNRLIEAYVAELDALREHGRDFAASYPDIAARLDIGPRASRDPHVERVVESAAFLAARLRRMIEEDSAELPFSMLSILAPALAEPVPSMAVAELTGGNSQEKVARGTRFDAGIGGRQVCFRTTMEVTVAPLAVRTELAGPGADFAAGLTLHFTGFPAPDPLHLYLGADHRMAAVTMDAMDENLSSIALVRPDGRRVTVPRSAVHVHGIHDDDAALPVRRAAHAAHRVVTEFLVFPEKFRFISLRGLRIESGDRLEFRFNMPLSLTPPVPADLISANRAPLVNLWRAGGSPIDIDGRRLEYPVGVDALRYRTVECHSVEDVYLHSSGSSEPQRLDPLVATGELRGSRVRWGVRRKLSRSGGEVSLYFQGLDYSVLGRQRLIAMPAVIASNRDLAQHLPAGSVLTPVDGLGSWRGALVTPPTRYRNAPVDETAMMNLIGYLRSGVTSLISETARGALRDYLKRFPAGDEAQWIDGIGSASLEPVTVLRHGQPQPGVAIRLRYDAANQTTASRAAVRRVLANLFESQRGLNRVEELQLEVV